MRMRRKADELLREWRDRADRKPLLVKGVRQCGKTYLLRTYAQDLFESVVYVNLENDRSARDTEELIWETEENT